MLARGRPRIHCSVRCQCSPTSHKWRQMHGWILLPQESLHVALFAQTQESVTEQQFGVPHTEFTNVKSKTPRDIYRGKCSDSTSAGSTNSAHIMNTICQLIVMPRLGKCLFIEGQHDLFTKMHQSLALYNPQPSTLNPGYVRFWDLSDECQIY